MKERSDPFDSTTIAAEACAWIAQLESGSLTRQDIEALAEWTRRSPRHAEELRQYAHLWNDLDILSEMAGPLEEAAAADRTAAHPRRHAKLMPRMAAACVALGLVVLAAVLMVGRGEAPSGPFMASTAIGEQRQVRMPDKSVANLNTNSRIEVDYDGNQRKIRLLKGEAFFDVVSGRRPFTVYAADRVIRAVGTAFAVRLHPESIEVTVAEGTVELAVMNEIAGDEDSAEISRPPVQARPAVLVGAGQRAVAGDNVVGHIETVSEEDIERTLAWRNGDLEFSGQSLPAVVNEVSRYTPLKIIIKDSRLEEIEVGGIFKIGETEALFEALEESFGVEVQRAGNLVYLSTAEHG